MNTLNNYKIPQSEIEKLETEEWIESLNYVLENGGEKRVRNLLKELQIHAHNKGVKFQLNLNTPYINTIHQRDEPPYPGNREIEKRIKSYLRWNAMAMVVKANKDSNVGGHISTYASSANLLEVGFNHFFRNASADYGGDLVYFQGHSAPGVYARAYMEGRITEKELENFRRELSGKGLSSYPHPRLMPNFWQFPTVSMGLGPIMAIYQARFIKYLENRGLKPRNGGKVWAFVGDGETDEPETLGAINLASREGLDNLIFVINCNLQRLDGPVRGNGKIIQELARPFRGSGWNVIKLIWGQEWDSLLEKDHNNILLKRMEEALDGDYQIYSAMPGSYIREKFFGTDPFLLDLVKNFTDDELLKLKRGGHDPEKVYSAYHQAVNHVGGPTVILAKTIKGYGMGESGEGKNISHQQKKLNEEELLNFRTRFGIPLSDEDIHNKLPFCKPPEDSVDIKYMKERRNKLGGYLPSRTADFTPIKFDPELFEEFLKGTNGREVSTTMAFVRLLSKLLKEKSIGSKIVPIVPDEARTFGMESLFKQSGIYSSLGQNYEPVDKDTLLYYKEMVDGQILEEGINEAGAMSSFIAAGTAYSSFKIPMIPFYIYYSMFGFQRIGDLAWVAGDIMAKGFMLGATAGRTTLNGEGLQHQDGHSHVIASTIPSCLCYDPAYAYELAVIIKNGLKRMYQDNENIFYYLTLENENYPMPKMPDGVEEGILKGIYKLSASEKKSGEKAHLLCSASIINSAFQAKEYMEKEFDVSVDIWSVTSFVELRRDALNTERYNLLNFSKKPKVPYITDVFSKEKGVAVFSTDYMKILPDGLCRWMPLKNTVLGTDGFGMSESREALRDYFEIDYRFMVLASLKMLIEDGKMKADIYQKTIKKLDINVEKNNPMLLGVTNKH